MDIIKIVFLIIAISSCNNATHNKPAPLFEVLNESKTGLGFNNKLAYTKDFNLFNYTYFYNGSGIGAGDFNNDGLIDLFFSSNQGQNKLYLNRGNLKFKDVTTSANIPQDGGWSTGVSVVDINNDGLLDIYVCRVGNYETLKSRNQLLICQGVDKQGIPVYKDEAHEYGLDFSGFSTQAAFFDYDNDGDLDMFLLNHSVHEIGIVLPRKDFLGTYHPLTGDRIYRNNGNNTFTDVTKQTGINSSAISYGLGVAIADVNLDGYPDIYVTNDFHENDYLYINQKDGTFKDESETRLMHTSKFSMGVDVADLNNDAFPEIFSMDMLPDDPYILKTSMGEDAYDIFNDKISKGYSYQYTRNNLQYNRRNGLFSEVGLYSGLAATDWSWGPLWLDFDNDGLKDLFISNGISKRMNDIDYINFISGSSARVQLRDNFGEKDLSLIDKFPQIKLTHKFFKNNGELSFSDEGEKIDGNIPSFSNGCVYADFDNDGDLDIVVNNIDEPAILYENKTSRPGKKSSLQITLKGSPQNINAVGAKVIIYANNQIRSYEKFPVRGYMSSMEIPVTIGLNNTKIDSAFVIWPDNTFEKLALDTSSVTARYKKNLPSFDFTRLSNYYKYAGRPMVNITKETGIDYLHEENFFNEFDREPLIPHMVSTEGPALAVADINHDGLEDVFIGSAENKKSKIFLQLPSGKFTKSIQPALDKDSAFEDVNACFTDVNNDGKADLVVVSGESATYFNNDHSSPRLYLNDGKANFTKVENAFNNIHLTASSVTPYDFNGDGYTDLFIGARAVAGKYGEIPKSYLLLNDKSGKFTDVTDQYAKGLSDVGFVTSALWFDIDKDGDKDLLISLEWGGIIAFINNKGYFTRKVLSDKNGWWNFILPCDIDNDGDIDLIAGNLGLNSRLKASPKEPVKLYYNDFDDNGKKEQVLTYFVKDREIPFAGKAELEKQLPNLKKKFLYAKDFAGATLAELFTSQKLNNARVLTADYFSNAVLVNKGGLNFQTEALPMEAQLSSYKDAVIVNANNDSLPDILITGNYYDNNIEMGRYDADYGTMLINKGQGKFVCETLNGLSIKGQVRHIKPIGIAHEQAFILARNNDSAVVIKFAKQRKK